MNKSLKEVIEMAKRPKSKFTPEIDEAIMLAREGKAKVSYRELSGILKSELGVYISYKSLCDRYLFLKGLGNEAKETQNERD